MIIDEIRTELKKLQDVKYREMQVRIIPTVKPESIIGVRTPELRQIAKQYAQAEEIMSPKVFRTHREELLNSIREWIGSKETYTIRFGIGMLMEHYLDGDFDPAYPEMAAGVRSEEYYVNMMTAWYFATALAKQYDAALPYIEQHRLDDWTHNKAIQKAIESYRITPEQKDYLRTLKTTRK